MYKGMYIAATGAVMRSNDMDNVANNLANVNTSGYKKTTFSSRYYPILEGIAQAQPTIYPDARAMTYFGTASVDATPGPLQSTGNVFDLAIRGEGYFAVEKGGQTFYTRSGAFSLNKDGVLVTGDGMKVLDRANQPISVDPTEGAVTVASDGNIYLVDIETKSNTPIAELKIVKVANVKHAGNSLYTGTEEDAIDFEVVQGGIERSNVNPVRELIGMIDAQRQYEMAQKIIQNFDALAQRAVTDIANTKV